MAHARPDPSMRGSVRRRCWRNLGSAPSTGRPPAASASPRDRTDRSPISLTSDAVTPTITPSSSDSATFNSGRGLIGLLGAAAASTIRTAALRRAPVTCASLRRVCTSTHRSLSTLVLRSSRAVCSSFAGNASSCVLKLAGFHLRAPPTWLLRLCRYDSAIPCSCVSMSRMRWVSTCTSESAGMRRMSSCERSPSACASAPSSTDADWLFNSDGNAMSRRDTSCPPSKPVLVS